jgi:hypothetical protein
MKITYNDNPLATVVELDDKDRELLKAKIWIEKLEDDIFEAHHVLMKNADIETAIRVLDVAVKYDDDENKDKYVNWRLNIFEEALKSNHWGDCTCVPSSCIKCYAEDLLGIDTIKGLWKQCGVQIQTVFVDNTNKSIDEAIEELTNYNPVRGAANTMWLKRPQAEWDACLVHWQKTAKKTVEWLIEYQATKLVEDNNENV